MYPPFLLSARILAGTGVIHQLSVFYVVFSAAQAASSNNRLNPTGDSPLLSVNYQPRRVSRNVGMKEITMKDDYQTVYEVLHRIYETYRRHYPENPDSEQICCMWSTDDPPDIIEGTPPLIDIEDAFDISIDDDTASELYDIRLDEAARKIIELRKTQCQQ